MKDCATRSADQVLDLKKKFEELRAIEITLRTRARSLVGPRMNFSALLGSVVGGVAMAGFAVLSVIGIKIEMWAINYVTFLLVILAFGLGCRYSKKPRTYAEKLDGQLTRYEPVDLEAYRQLQDRVKQVGLLNMESVLDWLEQERHAVALLAAGIMQQAEKSFPDK